MSLSLLDWRRRVAALYAQVRATSSPREAHAAWIATRDEMFARHHESPLLLQDKAKFAGLLYEPYDPSVRFEAEVDSDIEAIGHRVETGTDGIVEFRRIGQVHLDSIGSLDVWWLEQYGGGVFLPIADRSPAHYPGGRYVLDTVKGADLGGDFDRAQQRGTLVVDLNFAYNPSCAYDPMWACPLAPGGNRFDAEIRAGECFVAS